MKLYMQITGCILTLLLFSFTAMAAGSGTQENNYSKQQDEQLNTAQLRMKSNDNTTGEINSTLIEKEPLKNAFYILLGGLTPAILGLVGVFLNNKQALIRQSDANKHQIKMLQLEEKKKIATEILLSTNPSTIHIRKGLDIINITKLHHIALLICPDEYCCYTKGLIDLALQNHGFSHAYLAQFSPERRKEIIEAYATYYNICIHVSRLMLAGKDIIPTHGWNIDNFMESVPLDYRESLT